MANAGSGKTTVLTEQVIRLLLLGVPPERIVCITYTKAAASEMRGRVLKKLRELLLMEDAPLSTRIETLLGKPATLEQLYRARLLFGTVLDSPGGGLELTTIHGFCQNILRRFPLEAGIAPHFTVLEESAVDELLRSAKQTILNGIQSADAWLAGALAVIGARGGETRFDALANDIVRKKHIWRSIWNLQTPQTLQRRLWALHGIEETTSAEQLRADLVASLSQADERMLRDHLPQLLSHTTKSYREFAENLEDWLSLDCEARLADSERLLALFLTKIEPRKRRQYLLDKKHHPESSPLATIVDGVVAQCLRYLQQLAALHCAEETFAVAILARTLLEQYETAKEMRHALDFDDLIRRTLQLIALPEMLGWVMSKLDHRIDHLLIDEAQDNSSEQWELARILVEELIASTAGVGSAGLPRSVLVVGDEKQSIYSFQGAAPQEFSSNQVLFGRMLDGSSSPLAVGSLLDSYRSAQAILTLVDTVCRQPEIASALSSAGIIPSHRLKRHETAGKVVLYPPVIAPDKARIAPLTLPIEYFTGDSATQMLADRIADAIRDWLFVEKRPLAGAGRALRAGDILILVRTRTRLVPALIRSLQRRDIPVAGLDRLTLSDHLAVRDLLALMRWCGNREDDLALAQVLRSPLVGWSDEELRDVAYGRSGSLWASACHPWLAQLWQLRRLTPYDFLTQVLEISGRRREFARRFGEEVHEVLDELKAQAVTMPEGMAPTLAQFHDWVAGSTRQIKREQETGGTDRLRIMTVHGAKGLEAPVVLLADTVRLPDTTRELLFTLPTGEGQTLPLLAMSAAAKTASRLLAAKQQKLGQLTDEYYRLLYVALTRARDELHVFGTADKKGEIKQRSWYEAVAAALRSAGAQETDGLLVLADIRPAIADTAGEMKAVPEPLPAWAHETPVEKIALPAAFVPSRIELGQAAPYAMTLAPDARQRGVRIHRILELLRREADFAHLDSLVAHIAPDWDEKTKTQAVQQVRALHEKERWLWAHPRMEEASMSGVLMQNGEPVPVSGQADLLIRTPENIIVLDYKTGANVPVAPSQVPFGYLLQLKIYQAIVAQLYPQLISKVGIVWTHSAKLMWLDDEVKNTPLPPLNTVVKSAVAA